jgi:predicted nucleic acid-binding protein
MAPGGVELAIEPREPMRPPPAFEQAQGRATPVPACAELVATRRALGRLISQFDAQIAAIALAARLPLATRHAPNFEHCGIELVSPWQASMARPLS